MIQSKCSLNQQGGKMTSIQKKALKRRMLFNVRLRKLELRKLEGTGSRFHFRSNRFFKQALSNLKKEIRLYNRLGSGLR